MPLEREDGRFVPVQDGKYRSGPRRWLYEVATPVRTPDSTASELHSARHLGGLPTTRRQLYTIFEGYENADEAVSSMKQAANKSKQEIIRRPRERTRRSSGK